MRMRIRERWLICFAVIVQFDTFIIIDSFFSTKVSNYVVSTHVLRAWLHVELIVATGE